MKKFLFMLAAVMTMLFVVGCGAKTDNGADNTNDDTDTTETTDTTVDEGETEDEGGEDVEQNENGELTLQVLQADQDEGITIENNELYQILQEAVDADPLMGDPNDLSLFPFDIVEYDDGSSSLIMLVINRLDNPIRNLIFTLTFGNDEGDYIFDDHLVDLPEEYLGVLDTEGVVPILLDIEDGDEELFNTLTLENVYLKLDDVGIDFAD